jgi:AcrR family transcriptional regulator
MSLYTYLPGKAELFDLMVDAVYAEVATPDTAPVGWRSGLEAVARRTWALYLRHPWLLQVATTRPVLGPGAMSKYEHELRVVAGSGLAPAEADLVVAVVTNYVHGSVRRAVELTQAEARTGMTDRQWWQAYGPVLAEVFDAGRFPSAAAVGAGCAGQCGAAGDPARAFDFGLTLILDGLAGLINRRTGPA